MLWEQRVGGSNPLSPTRIFFISKNLSVPVSFLRKNLLLKFNRCSFSSCPWPVSPTVLGVLPDRNAAPFVGLVVGDALYLLRGATSLIKGRSCVLSQAKELDRAKSETCLLPPPDGVETTLRQQLAVTSTGNIETLTINYRQFTSQNWVQWNS